MTKKLKNYFFIHENPKHLWQLFKGIENRKYERNRKQNSKTWARNQQTNIKCNKPMNRRAETGQLPGGAGAVMGGGGMGYERQVHGTAWHGMAWKIWCAMALGSKCDWPAATARQLQLEMKANVVVVAAEVVVATAEERCGFISMVLITVEEKIGILSGSNTC